jgi:hypothetical protein
VAPKPPQELHLDVVSQSEFPPFPSELSILHEEAFRSGSRPSTILERPLSNRAVYAQNSRSITSISTENSSLHESNRTSHISQGIFGLRWGRSPKPPKKTLTRTRATAALPDSIQFCFSSCAKYLLVWARNGESIVRICAEYNDSKLLSLSNSIPNGEVDRSVNIKFVAEGEGWISVILLNKQVC